jgi:hypothetical protein
MDTKTPLAEQPSMDDMKIGPGGQTFGQLKQAVRDSRAELMAALFTADVPTELMERHSTNTRLLEAAYVRVGLPYAAP